MAGILLHSIRLLFEQAWPWNSFSVNHFLGVVLPRRGTFTTTVSDFPKIWGEMP
jgi:hypothetical protein